jgi:hypothetical protein
MLSVLSKDLLEGRLVKWKIDGRMEEMRGERFQVTGKPNRGANGMQTADVSEPTIRVALLRTVPRILYSYAMNLKNTRRTLGLPRPLIVEFRCQGHL